VVKEEEEKEEEKKEARRRPGGDCCGGGGQRVLARGREGEGTRLFLRVCATPVFRFRIL
jgi:hypothetical protein